jgi:hypothetical protein
MTPAQDPQAYRERLFTLVADRNPLNVLAQTASTLNQIVRAHSSRAAGVAPCDDCVKR